MKERIPEDKLEATDATNSAMSSGAISWLDGKYPDINSEINSKYQYVSIGKYYWQGEQADEVINELFRIYAHGALTVEEAIVIYKSRYLDNEHWHPDGCCI